MSRRELRLHYLAFIAVGGTGLVYAVMRYLMTPDDPWAVVNHPLQPMVQHLHVLLAPLLVFSAGILWNGHVRKRLRDGDTSGRATGLAAALTMAPMILSGYLLQIATHAAWRKTWIVLHVSTSLLWLLSFAVHQAAPAQRRTSGTRSARRRIGSPERIQER